MRPIIYEVKDNKVSLLSDNDERFTIRVANSIDPEIYKTVCIIEFRETGEKIYLNRKSAALLILALAKLQVQEATSRVNAFLYENLDIHALIDHKMQEVEKAKKRRLDQALLKYINERMHEYYDVIESQAVFCKMYEITPSTFSSWRTRYDLPEKQLIDKGAKLGRRSLFLEYEADGSPKESYRRKFGKKKTGNWLNRRRERTGLIR